MHMQLDVNTEIYPLHDGEKFMIVLASTLNLDGTLDSGYFTQIYIELDKFGEELVKHPEKSSPSLFVTINGLFSKLEASIGHFYTVCQSDFSVDGSYSFPLMFEKFPEVNQEGSQWTNCEIRDAINLIYENLHKLDSYLNVIVRV